MKFLQNITQKQSYLIVGALLFLAAALRLIHLTADPPYYFAGLGQALITDPYHITLYARNKALFGEWNVFDYDRWVAFKVSLVSGFSWLVFATLGVSRVSANLTSVILNLSSLILIGVTYLRFGYRCADDGGAQEYRIAAIIGVGLLAVSHPLIVYSRAPFLENGLIFLSAVTLFVTVGYGRTMTGAFVAGALVPLCALSGKLFGVALAVPALVTLALYSDRRLKRIGLALLGAFVATALWYLLILGDSAGAYHAYLQEQSLGLYGAPPALSSPLKFLENMISYGGEFRLWHFQPFVPALFVFGGLYLLSQALRDGRTSALSYARENPMVVFLFLWALCAYGGLMLFQYRPLRYSLFVLTPMLALCGLFVAGILGRGLKIVTKKKKGRMGLAQRITQTVSLLIGIWFVITQARSFWAGSGAGVEFVPTPVWSSLPYAISAVVVFVLLGKWFARTIPHMNRALTVGAISLVALSVVYQGYWYQEMVRVTTHELSRFSRELGEAVGPSAVFSAPHAPNLTLDNDRQNLIYSFGLQNKEFDLFDRYTVTHIAADVQQVGIARSEYPALKDAYEIARFLHRDGTFTVYRVRSAEALRISPETLLEKSERFIDEGLLDSALIAIRGFCDKNPDNLIGRRSLLDKLMRFGKSEEALFEGRMLIEKDPTGSWTHALVSRVIFYIARKSGDSRLRGEAEVLLRRAQELSPTAANYYAKYVQS